MRFSVSKFFLLFLALVVALYAAPGLCLAGSCPKMEKKMSCCHSAETSQASIKSICCASDAQTTVTEPRAITGAKEIKAQPLFVTVTESPFLSSLKAFTFVSENEVTPLSRTKVRLSTVLRI